ncbi:MAG: hypothetical protein KF706_08325 [Chitinophagales bacterium]|nr:hypothetical protein [Chitinophagales bacterium]
MKKINLLIVVFVSTLVLFSACKKDDNENPVTEQGFFMEKMILQYLPKPIALMQLMRTTLLLQRKTTAPL